MKQYFVKKIEDRLYLASRDIKIGNDIKLEDGDGIVGNIKVETNIEFYIKAGAYKIIGQISNEALSYVKEGDKFEHLKDCWISNSEIGQLDTYMIKCPTCKHFH